MAMPSVCVIPVQNRVIELRVSPEAGNRWRWSISVEGGLTLNEGVMTTEVAAQLASQRVFEDRLHKAGLNRHTPEKYLWKEAPPIWR